MFSRRLSVWISLFLLTFVLAGCSWVGLGEKTAPEEKTLVIPDLRSAKEQYEYAAMYQNTQFIAPEPKKRKVQLDKVSQCHERVIKNFPNDVTYTPLSHLAVASCLSNSGAQQKAIERFQWIAEHYSSNEFVQATALFQIGKNLDRMGKYQEAKVSYRDFIDRFGSSQNGRVQRMIKEAKNLYVQVREEPSHKSLLKKKKPW